jgi:hypothetical protein
MAAPASQKSPGMKRCRRRQVVTPFEWEAQETPDFRNFPVTKLFLATSGNPASFRAIAGKKAW